MRNIGSAADSSRQEAKCISDIINEVIAAITYRLPAIYNKRRRVLFQFSHVEHFFRPE
jgi:hypothetical protein